MFKNRNIRIIQTLSLLIIFAFAFRLAPIAWADDDDDDFESYFGSAVIGLNGNFAQKSKFPSLKG